MTPTISSTGVRAHLAGSGRFRRIRLSAAALLCAALLGACHTPYQRPDLQLPARWAHGAKAADPAGGATDARIVQHTLQDRWWAAFGDAQLNELVELALARNNDLRAAGWRLRNARLAAGNAWGKRLPTLNASGSASASRDLKQDASGPVGGTTDTDWQRRYSASVGINWELDLWGKLAGQHRAADWEAAATWQDRQATAQALVANVLGTYWRLAVAEQKWRTQQDSLLRAQKTLQLAQVQYEAGAISGLDLAQARQTLARQQAAAEQIAQQRSELQHALAILFDLPPGHLDQMDQWPALREAARQPQLPPLAAMPAVAAGVPADVLGRRPDLQAAELRLRATLAQGDAVRASYLPGFSLTSSMGSASTVLKNVLSHPTLSLGLGVALPFLNVGEMQRNLQTSRNNYELAVVNFRQTLHKALAEVENALSARQHLQLQWQYQQQAHAQAKRAEQLTAVRYRAGAISLKHWLDAQEALRDAALAEQEANLARLQNHVALVQALGGSPVLPDVADATAAQAAANAQPAQAPAPMHAPASSAAAPAVLAPAASVPGAAP
ncbi:MAG: efflux transporter outer membrane subunit [Brachymonas sp.]|nr:efflux transporter outer membrane subunit [Brachymonas sp.]